MTLITSTPSGQIFDPATIAPLHDVHKNDQLRKIIRMFNERGMPLHRIAVDNLGSKWNTPSADIARWLNGEHLPLIGAGVSKWLDSLNDVARDSADQKFGFVETPTVQLIWEIFDAARQPQGSQNEVGIGMVFGGSGTSKSFAAKRYVELENQMRPPGEVAAVWHQVDGDSSTWEKLLRAILNKLGVYGPANRTFALIKQVTERLMPGGIIILDEAQLLKLSMLMKLRAFCDVHGIALGLMGNAEGYRRINDAKVEAIQSRMGSDAVFIGKPTAEDITTILEQWAIGGAGVSEFMTLIASRDGGLRYLANTVREANRASIATGKEIDLKMLEDAAIAKGTWGRRVMS